VRARTAGYIRLTVARRVSIDAVVPALVAAVICAVDVAHSGAIHPPALLLGLAAGGSLYWRRRAPAATLIASGALTLALMHVEPSVGATAVIAPAVALYSLALQRGARARIVAAVAAVAAIVIADVLHSGGLTLAQTLAHAALVAIPLLIADLHRTRHANLELLRERVERQERLRIARDLHDVVAHTLTTINVQASTAAALLERNPAHVRNALTTIEDASRDAIDELRAVLGILRDDGDAPLRPTPGLDDVGELVRRTREDGVDVRIAVVGERPPHVPDAVSLAAYRIVQESLTNARRHAAGAPVDVTVSYAGDRVDVSIENGDGTANGRGPGVGIMGMTERAAAIGGTVTARAVERGFLVRAELPFA
jgi:signal transduction histidine kinase